MKKKNQKRFLALLLSFLMVFSVIPVNSYAEATSVTYTQITSLDQLTDGNYVLVTNGQYSGFAPTVFDGNKTLGQVSVTATDGKVVNPDKSQTWEIKVSGTTVTLTDSNNKTISAISSGVSGTAGSWNVEYSTNPNTGTTGFRFSGGTSYYLAYNKGITNGGFRAYADATAKNESGGYASYFTLYKLDGGGTTDPVLPKAAAPTANIPTGSTVDKGTVVTLASTATGAAIQYKLNSAVDWTTGSSITINETTTITAKTLAGDGYLESDPAVFTYTVSTGLTKAATPTANVSPGAVTAGTTVTFTSTTTGAAIQYKVNAAVDWTTGSSVVINANSKITARAVADGYDPSDEATFQYTIKTDSNVKDPIATIPEGSKSIKEVLDSTTATAAGTSASAISVVGQLVYQYGTYGSIDSAILEDVIDGEIYALQIFGSGYFSGYAIGDIVKVTGTAYKYGGVVQMTKPSDAAIQVERLTKASDASTIIGPQEFATISDLLAAKDSLVSEYVVIKNVTLGTYNSKTGTGVENTTVTDKNGISIPIYRAATYPSGVVAGDVVDLYAAVSKFNTTDQLRNGASTDYIVTNDTKAPVITLPVFDSAEVNKNYTVSVTITDNVGVVNPTLTYTIKATDKTVALTQDTTDKTKYTAVIPGTAITGITEFAIAVNAKDAAGNAAVAKTATISVLDQPQVTTVTPARNAKTGDNKRPVITVEATNLGAAPTAKLTLKVGTSVKLEAVDMSYVSGKFTYTPTADLADGRYTASVKITRADGQILEYEWPFNVGTPKYSLYFGQLHSHTAEYSDGAGTLASALDYINNLNKSDNVNFVAFTDHSNYFDATTAANPEASLYDESQMTAASRTKWDTYKKTARDFNQAATNKGVVALPGFEMTWSGGPGHINTWNTEGLVSRNNTTLNSKTNDAGMKAYYALLKQDAGATSVSQFNHPGTTFGTFADFSYWDAVIDSRISLVEVGNGEGAIGSGGYFPSYQYYTMALDKGWHVGPTNNQDNHKGKWGNANDARDVVITDDFSEQGIYDALKDRRVYATEDKNLEITYTVNDEVMGSIIKEAPQTLNLNVTVSDPDATDSITKVEVIVNSGRVAYTWDVNAQSKELTATLTPDYSYYYLRVTEKDGDLAVTAPVWVGEVKKLGISNLESGTAVPVTNEAVSINTTFYNVEATDATIKSITYKAGTTVLGAQTAPVALKAGSESSTVTFSYTPTKAKVQTITVEAVIEQNGIELTFTKDLTLNIKDASKFVYIGIDGSHYNEYVTGNYKDSMGNFSKLAAENNVRCVTLNTSADLLTAAANADGKYKMIILTAPSRRLAAAQANPGFYSDKEIAAIKAFSEAGGSVVLCGWSDTYENYAGVKDLPAEMHMAGQQNKLLAALGSTLRISDDATWDEVNNAGGSEANKARLYFSAYNWSNPLTAGIVYDEKHNLTYATENIYTQFFSQYGGASIYAVDKDGKATSTLASTVSPVVYAHSTTISKDNDSDLGSLVIPKYKYTDDTNRLMVMASETVTHANGTQSLVIADGAAFMSNFEIKATVGDTNAELNFSNYTILENLIKMIAPDSIDTIAEVQAETEEGVQFTVEGVVTSNASGYDKDTAFFDCIYLQDGTAGINAFPVAGNFKVGQKVRVTGTTSSYQGERQLNVTKISLVDDSTTEVTPKDVTAKQINDKTYLGSLVKISGTIESFAVVEGSVQSIVVTDANGNNARVFIDGYITKAKEIANLEVGNIITAVGLASYDNTFDGLAARIRVRDRADIVCTVNGSGAPVAPIPSTTPSSPAPDGGKVVTPGKTESSVSGGTGTVKVALDQKTLENAAKDGNGNVTVSLTKDTLKEVLADSSVNKGVVIDLTIPSVEGANVNNVILNTDALLLAKESGQKLTVRVANGDLDYTIDIPASELKKVTNASKDLNLSVSLEKDTKAAAKSAGVLTVANEGALTTGLSVAVAIDQKLSVKPGKKVYVYLKNSKTGSLEQVPNNLKTVAADGTINVSTLSGGEFVICTAKLATAVQLVDKVSVSAKSSVAKGQRIAVSAKLPKELEKVAAFNDTNPVGKEETKITYSVSDKKIAAISSNGSLKAKNSGSVKVQITVALNSGEKKTFTKTIKVK